MIISYLAENHSPGNPYTLFSQRTKFTLLRINKRGQPTIFPEEKKSTRRLSTILYGFY